MATKSFNQTLVSNGTSNGILTVNDSSGFEVGATVFLAAKDERIQQLKVASKPSGTSVELTTMADAAFDASAFTVAKEAKLFQPKSALLIPSAPPAQPFYSGTVTRTTTIAVPNGGTELVLNGDTGNALVIKKNNVEKASIDVDGLITAAGIKFPDNTTQTTSINLAVANVKNFGAIGNNAADDTAAIQAAIDYAIKTGKGKVYLPPGMYKITNTLHLGYGNAQTSCVLEGDNPPYLGENNLTSYDFAGATILPTFSDRPAINIQAARNTVIRNLSIRGLLRDHIYNNALCEQNPLLDDTVPSNWNSNSLHANQDSRYAPYAGITIDAFSGAKPATSYPNMSYPVTESQTQYGKGYSSNVRIENVDVSGFNTGVVVQPCDADGNGDFVIFNRAHISYCKYGISVGNSQSRNVSVRDSIMTRVFTCLTNNKHGKQIGKFGSVIDNLSTYNTISLFDFTGVYSGPILFNACYSESLWRLGDLGVGGGQVNGLGVEFNACQFSLGLQTDKRGVPSTVLNGGTSDANRGGLIQSVRFNSCHFVNFPSVVQFDHASVQLNGTFLRSSISYTTQPNYVMTAYNALAGGACFPQLRVLSKQVIHWHPFNLDTGSAVGASLTDSNSTTTSRSTCIPIWMEAARSSGAAVQDVPTMIPRRYGAFGKIGTFSSISLVNKTLTLVFNSLADWRANIDGWLPGDVVWDDNSGSIFFVKSRVGNTVTAILQNNYKSADNGATYTPMNAFSTTAGNLWSKTGRIYTASNPMFVNTTSGNTTASSVERPDGFSGFIESDILVGDSLYVTEHLFSLFSLTGNSVVSRSNSSKEIVFSGAASQTLTKQRLPFFIRKAPDNDT